MKPIYIVTAFAIAIVAAGLTLALKPRATAHATTSTMTTGAASADGKVPSVASMVAGLEERLANEPDDGKGWLLLAKSYQFLGRAADARDAYAKADALGNTDPVLAAQLYGLSPQ
jgi:cytochrome c-type biogenesis protein CcmH